MVWKSIYANAHKFSGYSYIVKRKTIGNGGKVDITDTTYQSIPLSIVPEQRNIAMKPDGHIVTATATAIVPQKFFSDNHISPSLDDFIVKGSVRYRVIMIQDLNELWHSGVYHLYLRRDELAQ